MPIAPWPTLDTCVRQALEDLYVHYDTTVRNSSGGIVQFSYGDDGMDPVAMEGKNSAPLDFQRLVFRYDGASIADGANPTRLGVTLSRSPSAELQLLERRKHRRLLVRQIACTLQWRLHPRADEADRACPRFCNLIPSRAFSSECVLCFTGSGLRTSSIPLWLFRRTSGR